MKRWLKKGTAMFMTGILAVGMLAGCGGGGGTNETAADASTPPAAEETKDETAGETAAAETATGEEAKAAGEVVEIRMVHMLNPEIQLENNPLLDYIEKELGIRLIIEAPPVNDFWERTQVMVATGDMPDFFLNGTDVNFEKWSQEGLLADITEDIKNYPNLMKNISPQQWGDTTTIHDGRIYGVPRCNSYDQWGFVINKKWLDAVGMEVPKTIEEFSAVCEAFTKNDPDGNGKQDTLGASFGVDQSGSIWNLNNDFLSTAFNISQHIGMPDKNGEYHMKQYSAEYYDYLSYFRELYGSGIIDKEFITHKGNEHIEKFAQNRVGIIGASSKSYMTDIIEKFSLNPDDYLYCAPLVQKEGDKPVYMLPPSNWCAFLINANSDKKDDILRLLDWANSEEGYLATHIGFEGVHYNSYDIENRTIDRTQEQETEVQKVCGNMMGFANAYDSRSLIEGGATPETTAIWRENTDAVNAGVTMMYAPFVKCLFPMAAEFPDDTKTFATLETRYVTGEIPVEELKSFSENELKPKIQKYEDEYIAFMKNNPVVVE